LFRHAAAFHCGIPGILARSLPPAYDKARRAIAGHSRLILFGFHVGASVQGTMVGGHRHIAPQMHTRGGATLLNFRSSLHSRFRFGLNRHKFATDVTRKPRKQGQSRGAGTIRTRPERRLADINRLPKR
jgi:hypothetical protein